MTRPSDRPPVPRDRLIPTGEVARRLGVDPKTVIRWADAGRLASVRTPGGHRRFRESAVAAIENGDGE